MAFDPIKKITSTVVPLAVDNIDTDQIIPARFLKATSRDANFGQKLFADWRYNSSGEPKPEFSLNEYNRNAQILLAGENFGCGSSREHAAWALYDYGFRVVLAPSFADIFRTNAMNNGILVIPIPENLHKELLNEVRKDSETIVEINLPDKSVYFNNGQVKFNFDINPFRSKCLQEGIDLLDFLLERKDQITEFEQKKLLS